MVKNIIAMYAKHYLAYLISFNMKLKLIKYSCSETADSWRILDHHKVKGIYIYFLLFKSYMILRNQDVCKKTDGNARGKGEFQN